LLTITQNLLAELAWNSDWNGDEVGFPEVDVVGLYSIGNVHFYINMETLEVLEIWTFEE
jgi:hypothetical protein